MNEVMVSGSPKLLLSDVHTYTVTLKQKRNWRLKTLELIMLWLFQVLTLICNQQLAIATYKLTLVLAIYMVLPLVYIKAPPHVCIKIKHEGVCWDTNTALGLAECCICLRHVPECFIFCTDKLGTALIDILYFHFTSALSCLNKIDGMRTSFYNLRKSRPKINVASKIQFLTPSMLWFHLVGGLRSVVYCWQFHTSLKLFSLAAIDIEARTAYHALFFIKLF